MEFLGKFLLIGFLFMNILKNIILKYMLKYIVFDS